MRDAAGALLQRILASRHFANAEMLKRILRYICTSSEEHEGRTVSEYEIALDAIGRRESFDPKLDAIVRVSVASIRQRLNSYFEAEGKNEPLLLKIPKGHYRAVYVSNEQRPASVRNAPAENLGESLTRFWAPHFEADIASLLVHSEPLFLRDDSGLRIRHIAVNNPDTALRDIVEIRPQLEGSVLTPYYAYLTVGTVYCMLAILRVFQDAGFPIELKSARSTTWQELRQANLVLIGHVGTNSYLDALQSGGNFVLSSDRVTNVNPRQGEQPVYRGERYFEGKLPRHRQYAVITRRPGLVPGTAITLIGALHGKAIEGAGQFLTSEDNLRGVLPRLLGGGGSLPSHFQLLIEVEMIDIADEVVSVECIAQRAIAP